MELNSKKLETTSSIVKYAIAIILAWFLIMLSNIIIDDIDTSNARPEQKYFENALVMANLNKDTEKVNVELEAVNTKKNVIENTISVAQQNYNNEKKSFDNWVETRKTLGSPDKDQEVTSRVKKLDELSKIEQDWRIQLNARQAEIDIIDKNMFAVQQLINKEQQTAEDKYYVALKSYELKVFLIRLLFVAPVLALGIFFFVRYRRHKFAPLFLGFSLFSVYAFFFGLVPYLPSYGGYVRYVVGVILSIGLGYYAIKKIQEFLEEKRAELKISTQERAKNVQIEVAEKALENHFCPSCGKDFLIKNWAIPAKKKENDVYQLVTDFCRYCGLGLFSNCPKCGNKNFSHLPFCACCGEKAAEK